MPHSGGGPHPQPYPQPHPDQGGGSSWPTVLDYLVARFPEDATRLREKVAGGEVVDEAGRSFHEGSAFVPGALVYLYRDAPVESRVPFEIDVLHRDDDLLVIDKPHFLASTPRGAYVVESAVVRLRRQFDLPEISPAHRLDRITAGVLIFTTRRAVRGAYQCMFAERTVHKTYEAVARVDPALAFPQTVRSRIVKEPGVLAAQEIPGEPNSESRIDLTDVRSDGDGDPRGRYELRPHTGKTHQLRLHMASLGLAICNDNFYPRFYDVAPDDYSAPLQLLARSVEFTDPLSGQRREFVSRRQLSLWPDSPT
ncbi:pseudouridine synthase [Sanguibacter gelidistatuariae]|nr:pseudouridine synthase [Sanguibacter gelidistatuariae]